MESRGDALAGKGLRRTERGVTDEDWARNSENERTDTLLDLVEWERCLRAWSLCSLARDEGREANAIAADRVGSRSCGSRFGDQSLVHVAEEADETGCEEKEAVEQEVEWTGKRGLEL